MKEKEIIILDDLYKKLLNENNLSGRWMYIDKLDINNWVNFIERHKEFSDYGEFQNLLISLEKKEFISLEYDEEFKNIRLKEKGRGNCEKRKSNQIIKYIYEFTIEGGCDKIKSISGDKQNEHWNKIYNKLNVKFQYYTIFSELMIHLEKEFLIRMDYEDNGRHYSKVFKNIRLTESGKSHCKNLFEQEDKYYHILFNRKHDTLNLNRYKLNNEYLKPLKRGGTLNVDNEVVKIEKVQIFKSTGELQEKDELNDCEDITKQFPIPILSKQADKIKNMDKVFIVHGHDGEAKEKVARFIDKLDFEPIILHEQVSLNKTIIEKIEEYSDFVDFGIVLYTPCDVGAKNETDPKLKKRARQNVVFEHGYLMAKIKRSNVCALVKGDVETPSDIDGILYIPMDDDGAWKFKIAQEMNAVGYDVDMNKLIKQKAN